MRFTPALFWASVVLSAQTIVIKNVTVVDSGGARPHSTVVIRRGHIAAVGKAAPPGLVVNGTGKYLIPGLWDMHVHLWDKKPMVNLYVANGVLGVRDMGSDFVRTRKLREDIRAGRVIGPQIYTSGPVIDGPDSEMKQAPVLKAATPEEARRAVDTLEKTPTDFVEILSGLSADAYQSVAQRARVVRMPFAGHLPESVSVLEAIDARQRSIEHLFGVAIACSPLEPTLRKQRTEATAKKDFAALRAIRQRTYETFSPGAANQLFHRMARFGVWQTPMLKVCCSDPGEKEFNSKLVKFMQDSGLGLLAGTDTGDASVVPGAALHDELEALAVAGLTPQQALNAATIEPARYFGNEASEGSIARGKAANLVLLDADPLADIRNTRRISAVFLNGRMLNRKCLDSLRGQASACAGLQPRF